MSLYAVGDIQGCLDEFEQLLALVDFNADRDRLWLVGDLVNRGPDSLGVLRRVMALGDAAVTVLGNHDLHLLAVAAGHAKAHRDDTLQPILDAPDCNRLLDWLRRRPLVVREDGRLMVHAGLLPSWTPATAQMLSREVEQVLASDAHDAFLRDIYGDLPARWDDALAGHDRLRAIVNACTRLRYCRADDTMELREKRGPAFTPPGFAPWFAIPERRSAGTLVICGHWSTLSLCIVPGMAMLDSGCLWGGSLTGLRLDDGMLFQIPSRQPLQTLPRE